MSKAASKIRSASRPIDHVEEGLLLLLYQNNQAGGMSFQQLTQALGSESQSLLPCYSGPPHNIHVRMKSFYCDDQTGLQPLLDELVRKNNVVQKGAAASPAYAITREGKERLSWKFHQTLPNRPLPLEAITGSKRVVSEVMHAYLPDGDGRIDEVLGQIKDRCSLADVKTAFGAILTGSDPICRDLLEAVSNTMLAKRGR